MDNAGHLLTSICACGPLLYLGLELAIYPAAVAASLLHVKVAFKNLDQTMQGFDPKERLATGPVPALPRIALRSLGVFISLFAFALIVGVR